MGFLGLFEKAGSGPELVTTEGINFRLETMFKQARQWICIISPYIRLGMRLRDLLEEKKAAGVTITVVHREYFAEYRLPTAVFRRQNLHAKCFLTEQAALLGSMNLYDYSQTNNDELGLYFTQQDCPDLYEQLTTEARRLCRDLPERRPERHFSLFGRSTAETDIPLQKGQVCNDRQKRAVFPFVNERIYGINELRDGNVVLCLRSSGPYHNEERRGILYYQGQNTGEGPQRLIYGNRTLYTCYENRKRRIFLFRDNAYDGEYVFAAQPFQKDGRWFFPLRPKG
ncbi:phospholipase D family protein [uncultured Desulfovibrio sp.]|uniref:phospholipase D family protein n=1 Tax=uncultured Desulfovibrio sp. TaxID=167968 RepID=UPI002615E278|nr:phospholipase D family protein [uncultured Desulfovibrio sp.]